MNTEKTPFIKDAKILIIEEYFNDELEDLLWRFRQIDEKTFEAIATELSAAGVSVSYEEVATWLSYLDIDTLINKKLTKPITKPTRPTKKSQTNTDKLFDPSKSSGEFCSASCTMASFCKYYERYEGKKCIVDLQIKQNFFTPIKNYIDKTYDRDANLKNIYINLAEQVASIYQIMKRKERLLNIKGVTQIERKIDPTSGKVVENEVPNPLAKEILGDSKQIMAMLKELGMTPKSLTTQNTGESDPASLSMALENAEEVQKQKKVIKDIKIDRHRNRPKIISKEQLVSLIEEKIHFDKTLRKITNGEDLFEDEEKLLSEKNTKEQEDYEPDKILNNDNNIDTKTTSEVKSKRGGEVEVPDEVLAILGRINQTEEK